MHFRNNNLSFQNSESVKETLKSIIPEYKETMNIYKKIEKYTSKAIATAKKLEINGKDIYDDNYSNNPHSDVYKIIEDIEKNQ